MMGNNSGISLVAALIVVIVVMFLGVAAGSLYVSKTGATANRLSSMRAQYLAEGGLERGIQMYKADCSGYGGETVYLGRGQFRVEVYNTGFDGTTALSNQARIRSTGAVPDATNPLAVRVVEQIATCPSSSSMAVASKTSLYLWGGSTIICGSQTCSNSDVQADACACAKINSSGAYPPVSVPGGLSAPGGQCQYNGGTFDWDGGTYYCANLQINNTSTINLTGPVTIYVGQVQLNKGSSLNWSGSAQNLLVMVSGSGYTALNSGSYFKGFLYAPGSTNFQLNNNSQVVGALVGGGIAINSGSDVIWDQTAGMSAPGFSGSTGSTGSSSDTTINWREPLP